MIQRFIELGDGYSDVYELMELANQMPSRIEHFMAIHTTKQGKELTSLAIVMKPTEIGEFQPIYYCLEGIPNPSVKTTKRYQLFEQFAMDNGFTIKELTVKPSNVFHDHTLYYQHLLGILRMNRFIKGY